MKRRAFLASLVASCAWVAGLFAKQAARTVEPEEAASIVVDDWAFRVRCDPDKKLVYRQDSAGRWRQIAWAEIISGDRVLVLRMDGTTICELGFAEVVAIGTPDPLPVGMPSEGVVQARYENLLNRLSIGRSLWEPESKGA